MVQRRNTHQRKLVYDAVQSLGGTHPTAGEVYEFVHERDEKVSLGTVYRNLNLLAESGDILAIKHAEGCHFDHRTDNHDHIVCVECGTMDDAMIEFNQNLNAKVAAATDYDVFSHYTVFEGVCPACQEKLVKEQKAS